MSINKVTLIGRLTRAIELKQVTENFTVGKFSLALNRGRKKDGEWIEEAHYIDCEAINKTAETLAKYTDKGHRLGITGHLEQDKWKNAEGKDRSRLKVVVEEFEFLEPKKSAQDQAGEENQDVFPGDPEAPF